MKNSLLYFIAAIVSPIIFIGCNDAGETTPSDKNEMTPGRVHVESTAMNFQMPDTISSGWNEITYENKSSDPHFILFEKYPEGKTIDTARNRVIAVFQEAMDYLMKGDKDDAFKAFGKMPAWSKDILYVGGTGLVSPGNTARTTLQLSPGNYLMECYVKMPDGKFHSYMGMLEDFYVEEHGSQLGIPEKTVTLSITNDGYQVDTVPGKGRQVFQVQFVDQKAHENFVGQDVHLARLGGDSDVRALEKWMDWMEPKGLSTPPPKGVEFLGGIQDMPAGSTAYFTADLSPGRYVLIAEVPNSSGKNLLKEFTVK